MPSKYGNFFLVNEPPFTLSRVLRDKCSTSPTFDASVTIDRARSNRKPRFADLILVWSSFSKCFVTCAHFSLLSSRILFFSKEDPPHLPHSVCMLMRPSDPLPSCCSEVCWIFFLSSNKLVSWIKISIQNVERICNAHCETFSIVQPTFVTHIRVCFANDAFLLSAEWCPCPQTFSANTVSFFSSLTGWKRPM